MLRLLGAFISLFLIVIVLLRLPDADAGLASFTAKSDVLGSPSSAKRFLDILTASGILLYLLIALQLNLGKNPL